MPDSAGTATAYLSGVKTRYGVIGVNENVARGECTNMPGNSVQSVLADSVTGTSRNRNVEDVVRACILIPTLVTLFDVIT